MGGGIAKLNFIVKVAKKNKEPKTKAALNKTAASNSAIILGMIRTFNKEGVAKESSTILRGFANTQWQQKLGRRKN